LVSSFAEGGLPMRLRCSDSDCALAFSEITRDPVSGLVESFRLALDAPGLAATARVYGPFAPDPAEFFRSLAEGWPSWPGERTCLSEGGEFSLSSVTDGKGHVLLTVRLVRSPLPGRWDLAIPFTLEAAQLDELAAEAAGSFAGA
jgi:hypothetical protein